MNAIRGSNFIHKVSSQLLAVSFQHTRLAIAADVVGDVSPAENR
jgi:hypothetical protein